MKIRQLSWYWGKYCILTGTTMPLDFELYDEEKHGWHNSEEFKNGQTIMPTWTLLNYRSL